LKRSIVSESAAALSGFTRSLQVTVLTAILNSSTRVGRIPPQPLKRCGFLRSRTREETSVNGEQVRQAPVLPAKADARPPRATGGSEATEAVRARTPGGSRSAASRWCRTCARSRSVRRPRAAGTGPSACCPRDGSDTCERGTDRMDPPSSCSLPPARSAWPALASSPACGRPPAERRPAAPSGRAAPVSGEPAPDRALWASCRRPPRDPYGRLQLRAEPVVLSGCQTGCGQPAAERQRDPGAHEAGLGGAREGEGGAGAGDVRGAAG
jgi:hypothetical protein